MFWLDEILSKLPEKEQHIINDAKSPSGPPHVGSLRGVLIHDAVYKYLKDKGYNVRYIFGSDDYDPMDEIAGSLPRDIYEQYLGKPLAHVPAPEGSGFDDLAMYFISDFFKIFDQLGVEAEKYYMRDYYKNGFFNEAIETVLNNAGVIREIYLKVSGAKRPDNWYPIQVVCEKCGKIGTTEVIDWDGKEVTYVCKEDKVTWAKGCGHVGKISPFDGNAKMPYKVEWAAKWKYFGVTIEGAGKDHNTKGGSLDIANAISRKVFGYEPPVNIPYEFFLVGGAKMSSSKGRGATARAMADFLPPEILRYLMLYTHPKRKVNFEPSEKYITKLFNAFDKLHQRIINGEPVEDWEKSVYKLSQIFYHEPYRVLDFSLITTMIQLPYIDIYKEAEKRFGSPLTETERKVLESRIKAAKYWLENFAPEEDKYQLQQNLPEKAKDLSPVQIAFLHKLASQLKSLDEYNEDTIQSTIFEVARFTPIDGRTAFQAIYTVFLGKDNGPKAGRLLAYIDKDFVLKRLRELNFDEQEFLDQSSITIDELKQWFDKNKDKVQVQADSLKAFEKYGKAFVELTYIKKDKPHLLRIKANTPDTQQLLQQVKQILNIA